MTVFEADRRSVLKLFGVTAVAAAAPALAEVVAPDKVYTDPFNVVGEIPKGIKYEWKRVFVDSQTPDMEHLTAMVASGWKPVPRARHPEMATEQSYWIERGGLVLMEKAA